MFYLVQSDVGNQIKATVTREDTGDLVDLSDATVRLKFRKKGSGTVLFTLTSIAIGEDPSDGVAIFAFASGNLDIDPGNYEGEIEAAFDDGRIESVYETLDFFVREDF